VKILSLIFFIFSLNSQLWSYQDSDIDGVDDTLDLCPDTSFDQLVNSDGCPEKKHYWGKTTLQLGSEISIDEEGKKINNYSFFGNYSYKKWYFSLSNTQQTSYDSNNNRSINGGDLYLNSGYQLMHNNMQIDIGFGVKVATANERIGTKENDYFASLGVNYFVNDKQILFGQIIYTLTGNNPSTEYQNSLAYSFGIGYMFNSKWYSTLSYDYADSIYDNGENYQSLSWLNSYSFLKKYFVTLGYGYGLDKISYPHTFSLKLGVNFE